MEGGGVGVFIEKEGLSFQSSCPAFFSPCLAPKLSILNSCRYIFYYFFVGVSITSGFVDDAFIGFVSSSCWR